MTEMDEYAMARLGTLHWWSLTLVMPASGLRSRSFLVNRLVGIPAGDLLAAPLYLLLTKKRITSDLEEGHDKY